MKTDQKIASPIGCLGICLMATALAAFTRICHGLLIPQVLEENADFFGKGPYILMYFVSVPAGLFLGYYTLLAFQLWKSNPQLAARQLVDKGSTALLWMLFLVLWSYANRNIVPTQLNWPYMLAVFVPWYGPIFVWALILIGWGRKLSQRTS